MKQKLVWLGLVVATISAVALGVWQSGVLANIYHTYVPVGEVKTSQVHGINGLGVANGNSDEFDFFVVGHVYGSQEVKDHKPDAALLAALPAISEASPEFMVTLGDMAEQSNAEEFDLLESTLLSQVSFPIFNAVGNHDIANRQLYEERFGATYFTFKYGPARMVILDTEWAKCKLDEVQTEMLRTGFASALRDANIRYVFVFMHRPYFFQNETLAAKKDRMAGPNEWKCYSSPSFRRLMEDVILPAASQKPVYLFAGDVGAWGNMTPYYEQNPNVALTMLMTGLGDTDRDNILHIRVDKSGVDIESILLNGMTVQPLEKFNPDYWEATVLP